LRVFREEARENEKVRCSTRLYVPLVTIRRRVAELEEQIDVYDQLLQRLRFKVDVQDREVIDRVLNQVGISLQSVCNCPLADIIHSTTHPRF
jgi:CRISPR/Cas system-associated exonuclease Cas4 (RecB family)